MHWPLFTRWHRRIDAMGQRLGAQDKRARQQELLRDPPARLVDARDCARRDAAARYVPLANAPVWLTGVTQLPEARRRGPERSDGSAHADAKEASSVTLPWELWRNVVDDLDGDVSQLLALRSSSKFFAKLVDERAATLFGPSVRRHVEHHALVQLPAPCVRAMYADATSFDYRLDNEKSAGELTRLLPCMPNLQVAKLEGSYRQAVPATPLPETLRSLTVHRFSPHDADAWVAALPPRLEVLDLCEAELRLRGAPTWPRTLRELRLQACTLGDGAPIDLTQLDALTEVLIVADDLPRALRAFRLPEADAVALARVRRMPVEGEYDLGSWTLRCESASVAVLQRKRN